jgi:hypothetical protein
VPVDTVVNTTLTSTWPRAATCCSISDAIGRGYRVPPVKPLNAGDRNLKTSLFRVTQVTGFATYRSARRSWFVVAALALGFCAILSLWPALTAPITADDRYWAMETPARYESYIDVVRGVVEDVPDVMSAGRMSPLGRLARRLVGLATFDLSHLTSTSLVVWVGVAKFIMLAAGVGSCLAFVKALRWPSKSGQLIAAGPGSLTIAAVGLAALLAAGVQVHAQFRNGWIAYPPHTYLAITIVFGSAAGVVTAARWVANRRPFAVPISFATAIVLAAVLNWTYELDFVGFPLVLFALVVFPLVSADRVSDDRRAKLLVGGVFVVSWLAMFVWTRVAVANACTGDCYEGTTLSLGPQVLRTFWYNVVSSLPGSSRTQFLVDLEANGASHLWSQGTPGLLWIVSAALGGSLWLTWRWASIRWPRSEDEQRAESRLLLLASGAPLIVGLSAALIMSVSPRYQEAIHSIGLPSRHTVLTWTAFSLALVLVVRSIELSSRRMGAFIVVPAIAILVALASAFTLPRNLVSAQAYRNMPAARALADIHWEVIAGDLNSGGDERRCESLERAEANLRHSWLKTRLEPAADEIFRRMNGTPYCSTWSPE